jgi:hypothetical protein
MKHVVLFDRLAFQKHKLNPDGSPSIEPDGPEEVVHRGHAAPTDPTVAGNDFDVVPAAIGAGARVRRTGTSAIVVKVISAQATAVSFRSIS